MSDHDDYLKQWGEREERLKQAVKAIDSLESMARAVQRENRALREQLADAEEAAASTSRDATNASAILERTIRRAADAHDAVIDARKTTTRMDLLAVAAYIIDRGEQYDQSSGIASALPEVAFALLRGEHTKALAHGELDDIIERLRK